MMRYILVLILSVQTLLCYSQGVNFDQSSSWEALKLRAKKEGKFIFLDCYATWCGPCRKMDKEVFPAAEIGEFINKHFIAAKFQMDVTKSDGPAVRARYTDVRYLTTRYGIKSFPSLLFLTPEGELLDRNGYADVKALLVKLKSAIDPAQNIAGNMKLFKKGNMSLSDMKDFSLRLRKMREPDKALEVAEAYKKQYLDKLPADSQLTLGNLAYVTAFPGLMNSREPFFRLFFKYPDRIDSITKSHNSTDGFVDDVVMREEVEPHIRLNGKPKDLLPEWDQYYGNINMKYGKAIADRVIVFSKIVWYNDKNDLPMAAKYLIQQVQEQGIDTSFMGLEYINTNVYNYIFKGSTSKEELKQGIAWMEMLIERKPDRIEWLDTYAGLLYKTGRVKEAIVWQKKAIEQANKLNNTHFIPIMTEVLENMKNNKVIW